LGSATPAFETYFNCKSEKFALVQLNQRFDEILPPEIILANIAEENRVKTLKGNFTSVLIHEIEKTLANKEQVILFQNRRGFAPVIECHSCHWIPKCQNCDISLTYHKAIDSLKCHYCSFTMKVPAECGACGSHLLNFKGFGTEKIEEELETLFPNARIGRLDLDAAKSKHGHEKIIQDFEDYKFDILVGTQMLSKGLDFEKVSLVGIINADQLLHFPDFRASERAFQLITQVGGRAGRKNKQGRVVIQTSSPAHPIIQSVIKNAYEDVYSLEMTERANYAYPPMMRVIKITIKHKEYKTAEHAAILLLDMLMPHFGDNIIGPASPYVSKIRNYYIKELLIKIDRNNKHLKQLKKFTFEQISKLLSDKNFRSVIIFADVDAG
jgi:primosomal protein N' (replication factor Y)